MWKPWVERLSAISVVCVPSLWYIIMADQHTNIFTHERSGDVQPMAGVIISRPSRTSIISLSVSLSVTEAFISRVFFMD